jgi:uncharacterized protein YegP (UPF0339 family)
MKTKHKAKVEIKKTSSGNQKGAWRFTIKAGNGETVFTSEGYTSIADAKRGFVNHASVVLEILGDRFRDWAKRHLE